MTFFPLSFIFFLLFFFPHSFPFLFYSSRQNIMFGYSLGWQEHDKLVKRHFSSTVKFRRNEKPFQCKREIVFFFLRREKNWKKKTITDKKERKMDPQFFYSKFHPLLVPNYPLMKTWTIFAISHIWIAKNLCAFKMSNCSILESPIISKYQLYEPQTTLNNFIVTEYSTLVYNIFIFYLFNTQSCFGT